MPFDLIELHISIIIHLQIYQFFFLLYYRLYKKREKILEGAILKTDCVSSHTHMYIVIYSPKSD